MRFLVRSNGAAFLVAIGMAEQFADSVGYDPPRKTNHGRRKALLDKKDTKSAVKKSKKEQLSATFHIHELHHNGGTPPDDFDYLLDCNGDGVHDHLDHHVNVDQSDCVVLTTVDPNTESASQFNTQGGKLVAVDIDGFNIDDNPKSTKMDKKGSGKGSINKEEYRANKTDKKDTGSLPPIGAEFDKKVFAKDGELLCRYRTPVNRRLSFVGSVHDQVEFIAVTSPKPAPVKFLRSSTKPDSPVRHRSLQNTTSTSDFSNVDVPEKATNGTGSVQGSDVEEQILETEEEVGPGIFESAPTDIPNPKTLVKKSPDNPKISAAAETDGSYKTESSNATIPEPEIPPTPKTQGPNKSESSSTSDPEPEIPTTNQSLNETNQDHTGIVLDGQSIAEHSETNKTTPAVVPSSTSISGAVSAPKNESELSVYTIDNPSPDQASARSSVTIQNPIASIPVQGDTQSAGSSQESTNLTFTINIKEENMTGSEVYVSDVYSDQDGTQFTYIVMACPENFIDGDVPVVEMVGQNASQSAKEACAFTFTGSLDEENDKKLVVEHSYKLYLKSGTSNPQEVVSNMEVVMNDAVVQELYDSCADTSRRLESIQSFRDKHRRQLNTIFTAVLAEPEDEISKQECSPGTLPSGGECFNIDSKSTVYYNSSTDYANDDVINARIMSIIAEGCHNGSLVKKLNDTNVLGCEANLAQLDVILTGREQVGNFNVQSSEKETESRLTSTGITLVAAFVVGTLLIAYLISRTQKNVTAREFVEVEEGEITKDDLMGKYGIQIDHDDATKSSAPPTLVEFVDSDSAHDDQSRSEFGSGRFQDGGKYNPHGTHVHNCISSTCEVCAANGRRLDPTFIGTYDMYTARHDENPASDTVDL